MPVPEPLVPLVSEDGDDELFFALFLADFFTDFLLLFVEVEPDADVSPAPLDPVPVISDEPDEPRVVEEDFADFLCLWCFFALVVPDVDPVVSVPEVPCEPIIPVSLDEPEPCEPIVPPVLEPEPYELPDPEPCMLLPLPDPCC